MARARLELGRDEKAHRAEQLNVLLADCAGREGGHAAVEQVHGESEYVVGAVLVLAHLEHPGGERMSHTRSDLGLAVGGRIRRRRVSEVRVARRVRVLESQQVGQHSLVVEKARVHATQALAAGRCRL